jgi:colicin import membrane protein
MAAVLFDKLKPAAKAMFDNAKKAEGKLTSLETWAGKEVDKAIWASIKGEAQKALESSDKLNKFADAKKDDGAEQAGKDLTAAVEAAREGVRLVKPLKDKATKDSEEQGALSLVMSALGQVTARERPAREALGLPDKPAAPADTTPRATDTKPTDTKPSAAVQQAVEAAAEALRQATEAETQANAIEKADDATVKDVADKVLAAARLVKTKAAVVKEQAERAKADAKESEKQAWDDAIKAAEAVAKPAGDLETAATAVAGKTKPDEIKKQATDSKLPTLATAAKTAADAANKKVETAKGAAPSTQPATRPSTDTGRAGAGEKKDDKKVPNSFGASITAAYSRKFSLDTTVHSKIEVTMVPYPPPQQFLDWIRAHYNQEHPSSQPKP